MHTRSGLPTGSITVFRRIAGGFLPAIAVLLAAWPVAAPARTPAAPAVEDRPAAPGDAGALSLLTWDLLTKTVYDPRRPIEWPAGVLAADGRRVRMEGYLMPRYGSQDPADLLLTGINPTNLLCGPTDLTLVVDLHLPGFSYTDWPRLPVEVTGTFHLSRRTGDYRPIYMFLGESWRRLKVWEQPFPGVSEPDIVDPDLDGE